MINEEAEILLCKQMFSSSNQNGPDGETLVSSLFEVGKTSDTDVT